MLHKSDFLFGALLRSISQIFPSRFLLSYKVEYLSYQVLSIKKKPFSKRLLGD